MFLRILRATLRLVYAHCLMPNHFHLLIETKQFPLSGTMQPLLTRYVEKFNFRHRHFFSLLTVVHF
jgi:REP element-mobilizing transposase RayT